MSSTERSVLRLCSISTGRTNSKSLLQRLQHWRSHPATYRKLFSVVGGQELSLLADTGSPITFIAKEFLGELERRVPTGTIQRFSHVPNTIYGGVDSATQLKFTGVAVFTLHFGTNTFEVFAAVLDGTLPHGFDLVLGNYDLDANNLHLTSNWYETRLSQLTHSVMNLVAVSARNTVHVDTSGWQDVGKFLDYARVLGEENVYDEPSVAIALRTTNQVTMEYPGVYALSIQRADGKQLPLGHTATGMVVLPYLQHIVLHPEHPHVLLDETGTGTMLLRKAGDDRIILPVNSIIGFILEDAVPPPAQTYIDTRELFDTQKRRLPSSKVTSSAARVAPVMEVPLDRHDHSPTPASLILQDPAAQKAAAKLAKTCYRQFLALSSDQLDALESAVKEKRKLGKEFSSTPAQPLPSTSFSSFPDAVRYQPLDPKDNANDPCHDDEEIQQRAQTMYLFTEDQREFTDMEFIINVGIRKWKHHSGAELHTFPTICRQALSRLFLYRTAGLLRTDYNKSLNKIKNFEYQLKFKEGEATQPINAGMRKYSADESLEICRQVMQLIRSGVLTPTKSAWSAALVLVSKASGGIRMCVDYRMINKKTLHEASQLPLIPDVLNASFHVEDQIFSQLDLSQAYHQLEVRESDRQYLAFRLPRITAEQCEKLGFSPPLMVTWKRAPFGLSELVTSYSNLVLGLFQPRGFSPYLDDLGLGSPTIEKAIDRVHEAFIIAAEHGLTFGSKMTLYVQSMPFLGHVVSNKGISLDPTRVSDLLKMPNPTSVSELRTYLGIVQFCAAFLGIHYSGITAVLTDLLSNPDRKDFGWTAEHDAAIVQLKELLTSAPTLRTFDNRLETCVITDGSARGVGAALYQKHSEGWRPTFYMSKKLSDVQRRWSTCQYELLAVVLALDRWRSFLIDKHFTLLTDHHALTYLIGSKAFVGRRLQRWQCLLAEFNFSIVYKKGAENQLSDALSRLFLVATASPDDYSPLQTDLLQPPSLADVDALVHFIDQMPVPSSPPVKQLGCIFATVALLPAQSYTAAPKKGSRVLVTGDTWGAPWPGTVVNGTVKSKKWSSVKLDAGQGAASVTCTVKWDMIYPLPEPQEVYYHMNLESALPSTRILSPLEPSPLIPASLPTAPPPVTEVLSPQPSLPSHTPVLREHQDDLPGATPASSALANAPPVIISSVSTLQEGDLVQVKFKETPFFIPGVDRVLSLGVVLASIPVDRVRVRLLTPFRPVVETSIHQILRLASRLQIKEAKANSTTAFDKGDVVVVLPSEKASGIRDQLDKRGILHTDYDPHFLVGVIVGSGSANHIWDVHFGDYDNGVYQLNSTDLALVQSGSIPLLSTINMGHFPFHLPDDKLSLLNQAELHPNPANSWLREVKKEQRLDPAYGPIYRYLREDILPPEYNTPTMKAKWHLISDNIRKKYSLGSTDLDKNLLFHHNADGSNRRLVIPMSLRRVVLFLAHDASQHFSWNRVYDILHQHYYFRGMAEITRRYCGECLTCQRTRNNKYYTYLYGHELAERMGYFIPRKYFAIDLKSLACDMFGFKVQLVIVDLCCRFHVMIPLKSKESEEVMLAISDFFKDYCCRGTETEFLADRGSEFTSNFALNIFDTLRVNVTFIGERTSQTNGLIERFMGTSFDHFRKAMQDKVLDPKRWSQWTKEFYTKYNSMYHSELGTTPYTLFHGISYSSVSQAPLLTGQRLHQDQSTAEQALRQMQVDRDRITKILKERYLKKHQALELVRAFSDSVPSFLPGSLVLLLLGDSNGGVTRKNRAHAGPFKVIHRESEANYVIAGADEKEVTVHGFHLVEYTPSLADMRGDNTLAATAVGAAQARLFNFLLPDDNIQV